MNIFNQAYTLYAEHVKGYEKIIASIRPHPGGKDKILSKIEGSPDEVWHGIQNAINYASSRYGNFTVRVARGTQNDPGAMELPIDLVAPITSPSGGYGNHSSIAGFGNPYPQQPVAPGPSIGQIKAELQKEYDEKLAAAVEKKELTDTIGSLVATVKELKKGGATGYGISDFVEQTGLNLSEPEAIQAAVGGINSILANVAMLFSGIGRNAAPQPGMAGTPGYGYAQRPKPGRTIVQQPSPDNVPTHEPATESETEEIPDEVELSDNDNMALDAVAILENAGFADAGLVLMQIANWAAANPEQARNYLQFLK